MRHFRDIIGAGRADLSRMHGSLSGVLVLLTLSVEAQEAGAPIGAADLAVWREPPALRALLLDDDVPSALKAVVEARAREIRGLACS